MPSVVFFAWSLLVLPALSALSLPAAHDKSAYQTLVKLLAEDTKRYTPQNGLVDHNHVGYLLVSLYRLGQDSTTLEQAFKNATKTIPPARPSSHKITDLNWKALIGHNPEDPVALFADYLEFYRGMVAKRGANATLELVAPFIIDGLQAGLFHAFIELSYYFESKDEEMLVYGLAWMSTSFDPFPGMNKAPTYTNSSQALMDVRQDKRLESAWVTIANSSWTDNLILLRTNYSEVLSEYDLLIRAEDDPFVVARSVAATMLEVFGSGNTNDFFNLHLVTSSRALETMLPHLNEDLQRRAIRAHFKACVYNYITRGAPALERPAKPTAIRPWDQLVRASVPSHTDAHLVEFLFLSRDNAVNRGDADWLGHYLCDLAVALFESGGNWKI